MLLFVTTLPGLIMVIFMLLSLVQMDPLHFYVVIVSKERLPKLIIYFTKTLRIVLIVILSQWLAPGIKLCVILSLSMAVSFQNVVKIVRIRNLSYSNISIYKQLIVERNILKSFEQSISSLGLFAIFLLLVVTPTGTIIAWKLNRLILFS